MIIVVKNIKKVHRHFQKGIIVDALSFSILMNNKLVNPATIISLETALRRDSSKQMFLKLLQN